MLSLTKEIMLKKHKNAWFELIEQSGINIANVQITEPDDLTFVLKIINTPLTYVLRQTPDNFDRFVINYTLYKPEYPLAINEADFPQADGSHPHHKVSTYLRDWLHLVALRYITEQNTPDFWSQSKTYSIFSNSPSIPKEELLPFSNEEKSSIKDGLKKFEILIIENFNPIEEQLKTITERLDYLSDSVDRLNRFDWKAQALSTLISIAINLGVDTETGNKLLLMFQQVLQHISNYLPPSIHLGH